jgi:hypothetical protein
VSERFLEALLAVRDAHRCDYAIPELAEPPTDWTKVVITMTMDGVTLVGTHRSDAADCTAALGDFYYDVQLDDGGVPAKITLCPA